MFIPFFTTFILIINIETASTYLILSKISFNATISNVKLSYGQKENKN